MDTENTLGGIERTACNTLRSTRDFSETSHDASGHTLDDGYGKTTASSSHCSRVVVDRTSQGVDELDDQIYAGLSNLWNIIPNGLEECLNYSCCCASNLPEIVGYTVENTGQQLEAGIDHPGNILGHLLDHHGHHTQKRVHDLGRQSYDRRYERFQDDRDRLKNRRSGALDDLRERDDSQTDLLHQLGNKADKTHHDTDDRRSSSRTCRSKSREARCEQEYSSTCCQHTDTQKSDSQTQSNHHRYDRSQQYGRYGESREDTREHQQRLTDFGQRHLTELLEYRSENPKSSGDNKRRGSTRKRSCHEEQCSSDDSESTGKHSHRLADLLPGILGEVFQYLGDLLEGDGRNEHTRRSKWRRGRNNIQSCCDDRQSTKHDRETGTDFGPAHLRHVLKCIPDHSQGYGYSENTEGC